SFARSRISILCLLIESGAACVGDDVWWPEPHMLVFIVWCGRDVAHLPQTDRLLVREKPGRVLRPQPRHISVLAENHLVAIRHGLENDALRFRQSTHHRLLPS